MEKITKIQKARQHLLKQEENNLLLEIEKYLKQVGKDVNGNFEPFKFVFKKKEYGFDSCLDSDKGDNYANLFIKVFKLLKSCNYELNDPLFGHDKLFFIKIVEFYDTEGSYSTLLKKHVANIYTNLYNLFRYQLFTKDLLRIQLPPVKILATSELGLKQINENEYGFDVDFIHQAIEPQQQKKSEFEMHQENGRFIKAWGLDGANLYVEFQNGRLYKYKNLDEHTITAIQIARDFEKTFQRQNIREHPDYERLN